MCSPTLLCLHSLLPSNGGPSTGPAGGIEEALLILPVKSGMRYCWGVTLQARSSRVGEDKALLLTTEDSFSRAFSWEQRNLPSWPFSTSPLTEQELLNIMWLDMARGHLQLKEFHFWVCMVSVVYILRNPEVGSWSVLGGGALTTYRRLGAETTDTCVSLFWRLEVQDQGPGRFGSW